MTRPAEARRRKGFRALCAAMIGCCGLLGACTHGDFGEIKPSLVREDIHDWTGSIGGGSPSAFQLTDDERQLRDLAFPLLQAPLDRQREYDIAQEYGRLQLNVSGPYPYALLSTRFRSPAARYARLLDDIRNDIDRAPGFFENAARVIDMDRKRERSLQFVSSLSKFERDNAIRRIRENAGIAFRVHESVRARIADYQFALERLVIATPSPQAADVERELNRLRGVLGRYRFGAPGRRIAAGSLDEAR